ncbi:hypothetical protein [Paenibacillus sp. 1P07SE]|uniref:hypothetical protein n=1 Tax=Paenibacillus sp. 1P07SE TaxID=3132209 RepID=UPI0039A5FA0F
MTGRDREAERWIGRFAELRSRVGERIAAQLGSATACFLRIMPSRYRVYGARCQTGALLYGDLGLSLPAGLEPERWAVELDRHMLMQLRPDHVFLMVDPMPDSRRRLRELTHSEQWRKWRPVKNGCIYRADDYLYAALGTAGRIATIDHAAGQLGVDVRGIVQAYLEEISIAR